MSTARSRRDAHAEETRELLIAEARRAFCERGFAGTSIDDVAAAARLTKGAVYHHFGSKRGLFRAVYEALAREVAAELRAKIAPAKDPVSRVTAGIQAFLVRARDDELRNIMFRDGMAVLTGECREIDGDYFLDVLGGILEDLDAAGLLPPVSIPTLSRLILSVFIEASHVLARREDRDAAEAEIRQALMTLLLGLVRPRV